MRISKIESDYMLQTPTAPINNRSYVKIYNDNGASIRPIARLDPEYPINEFEVNGAFHRQVDEAQFSQNLEDSLIMEESKQIGVVEARTENTNCGLKSIDKVNENVENFLKSFSR